MPAADPSVAVSMAMAAMFGVIGGVAVFGVLLVSGVALVRRLKLPVDLPDGPRFEPPPPPMRSPAGAVDEARAIAERQARCRAVHDHGLACLRAAQQCHELVAGLPARRDAATAAVAHRIEQAATTASDAAARAERRLADSDVEAAEKAVRADLALAEAALAEAEAAGATLPDTQRRRLMLWVLLGLVAIAWLAALLFMAATRR